MKMSISQKSGVLLILMLLLASCGAVQQPANPTKKGTLVSVVFYPQYFLAKEIGGDFVSVTQIVKPGLEPHEYEPTPTDIKEISSSNLFIYHGAGLDRWAEELVSDLGNEGVKTMKLTEGFNLLQAGKTSQGDPHVWLDPTLMQIAAARIATELSTIDPFHADDFEKNEKKLEQKLATLNSAYVAGLAQCRVRTIVTSHAAFGYLANRYNFTQEAISGLSPEDEPSVRDIQRLITLLKEKGVGYVLFETLASGKHAQTIAEEVGAQTLVLNPIEGLTDADRASGEDYISLMNRNLKTLRTAMECQ